MKTLSEVRQTLCQIGCICCLREFECNEKRRIGINRRHFSCTWLAHPVEESQIDAITALSGSGPAYVFEFISTLITQE